MQVDRSNERILSEQKFVAHTLFQMESNIFRLCRKHQRSPYWCSKV